MANSGRILERGLDGIAIDQATPASQPGDIFPPGVVLHYAGSSAPTNWLICDGSVVSRATYPNLFAAIGTTFGAGDGSTTFGIPDLRGKSIVGKHTSGTFVTLGQTGGEENHTLSNSEMPVHSHGGGTGNASPGTDVQGSHTHSFSPSNNWITDGTLANAIHTWGTSGVVASAQVEQAAGAHSHTVNAHNHSIGNDGGGATHNNMPPYVVLHHIIKAS